MKTILSFLYCALSLCVQANDTTFITKNDVWKYLDDGSNQGTVWKDSGFNDSDWAQGSGQLGFGDGDEATILDFGGNPDSVHVTYYFRKTISIADPSQYAAFLIQLLKDDAAVVYINGQEVFRSNLYPGTVLYTTESVFSVGASENTYYNYLASDTFFVAGLNTIAVEVHQYSITSSDLSFDLSLEAFDQQERVMRGPYLQSGTPNAIKICWRTLHPTTSRVMYGAEIGTLDSFVDSSTVSLNHVVELTGLTSNTQYYYSIGSATEVLSGNDANHYFKTAPQPGTIKPVRIWAVGDAGSGNDDQRAVRDAYQTYNNDTHTDMFLMLGDNAYYSGQDYEFQTSVFQDMYEDILSKTVLWTTPGNHDYYGGADATFQTGPYYDIFNLPKNGEAGGIASGTEAYYSFNYANIHFISLDSYDTPRYPGSPMLTWLQNDLDNVTAHWIVAFFHHPPYTRGNHNSDDFGDSGGRMRDMRQYVLPILEAGGVDLVLTGHSHAYERSYLLNGHYDVSSTLDTSMMLLDTLSGRIDENGPYFKSSKTAGTVYTVCGVSAKLDEGALDHPVMYFSNNENFGSLVIDVFDGQLDLKFINDAGSILDYFTMEKTASSVNEVIEAELDISLYPNPTMDLLQLLVRNPINQKLTYLIHDAAGNLIHVEEQQVGGGYSHHSINVTNLTKGIYVLSVQMKSGHRLHKKLIKY